MYKLHHEKILKILITIVYLNSYSVNAINAAILFNRSEYTNINLVVFIFYLNVVIVVETIDKDKTIDTKY